MTEQQQHLQSAIQQQNTLVQEIQTLQSQLDSKRQLALKAQGIIEYLDQIGVKLPEPETEAGTVAEGEEAPAAPAPADTQVVPS
tara:strand:+ start:1343 stop:1594 length:252 start_codon:yes stop_codon:yes gene_type:complete